MSKSSRAFIQHTQAIWQDQYPDGLSEAEASELASSLVEFFDVLVEWERHHPGQGGKGER